MTIGGLDLDQSGILLVATFVQLAAVVAAYFFGRSQGRPAQIVPLPAAPLPVAAAPTVAAPTPSVSVAAAPTRPAISADEVTERTRLLFRLAPDALLLCAPGGTVLDVNDYTVQLSGYSREELVGRSLADLDLITAAEKNRAMVEFTTLATGGGMRPAEFNIQRKDGRNLPVEVRGDVIPGPKGVTVLISARDVSEHKRAQSRIRDQQARLSLLFGQIPAHVWTTDVDLRILSAAGRGLTAIGVTEEELIGRPLVEAMAGSFATEQSRRLHLRALDGETNPFVATLAGNVIEGAIGPLRDDEGNVEGVVGIALNVTEQARARRRLHQREALLEQAQAMANMGSWEWDLASGEAYWSPHLYRLLGLDPSSPDVDPAYDLTNGESLLALYMSLVVEEDRERISRARLASLNQGIPYAVEHRVADGEGTIRWHFISGTIERNAEGEPTRSYGFVQEITEAKIAREEVRQLNTELESRVHDRTRQLEAAVDDLRSFSYAVSHDLRQPLRTIAGFLSLLEEEAGPALDQEAHGLMGRVKAAAHRMDALIGDLLALSRVTNAPLSRTRLDLSAMAAEVAREVASSDPRRSAEWIIQPGLRADGDLGLVRLVLENFFGNAWKFTRGRDDARIEFGAERASRGAEGIAIPGGASGEGEMMFFVRDNGAGFDPSQASRLFQPFQRLHDSKEFEGTGVGLATVGRIIRRHGGQIRAEGRRGAGATFRFSLARGDAPAT